MSLKFLVVIPVLTLLALGACATSPDRVPATFVSAKQHLFSGCRELAEDMAQQNFTVYNSKKFKEIAAAKGELNALARAGYEKHCGEQERPVPQQAQVIVVPQAGGASAQNYYYNQAPQQYAPAPYAQPQPQYAPEEYAPAYPPVAFAPWYPQMGRPAYPQPGRPAFFRGGFRAGGGGGSYSGGH